MEMLPEWFRSFCASYFWFWFGFSCLSLVLTVIYSLFYKDRILRDTTVYGMDVGILQIYHSVGIAMMIYYSIKICPFFRYLYKSPFFILKVPVSRYLFWLFMPLSGSLVVFFITLPLIIIGFIELGILDQLFSD